MASSDPRPPSLRWIMFLLALLSACGAWARPQPTLDDFWAGKAHFAEIRTIDWTKAPGGTMAESSAWFAVDGATWYAFNRAPVAARNAACPDDNMKTVVRASSDHGKTWTAAATVANPGDSAHGDGCAILDGASIYDAASDSWHMLAQCLALHNAGGWAMCHYTRKGRSPMGRFVADPHNPVVTPGMLWRSLCAEKTGICDPDGTRYEGTPDIVLHSHGLYYVTFHGYEPKTGRGFRGLATTPDFRRWDPIDTGLPKGAMLGPADCKRWIANCVGVGTASMLRTRAYDYSLVEAMDRDLNCTAGQQWIISLVRSARSAWPASGSALWEPLKGAPLIVPSRASQGLPCPVQYGRLFRSEGTTWMIYEEREAGSPLLTRRLFRLVSGGSARRLVLKN